MALIVPDKEGHWYDLDGNPVYQVPMKTRPGQMRSTTVTDAREMGLVPSVTTMISATVRKPELERWINMQYIMSALTLPMEPGESQDEFASRVVDDASRYSTQAADFGTNIHNLAEMYLNGELPSIMDPEDHMFITGFMEWCNKNDVVVIALEQSFANREMLYGGRVDFIGYVNGVFCIGDWKTQSTKPGKPMRFYPEWNIQLSAYEHGFEGEFCFIEKPFKINVVVSSTEPGRVESFIWLDHPEVGDWGYANWLRVHGMYFSPMGQGWKLLHANEKNLGSPGVTLPDGLI